MKVLIMESIRFWHYHTEEGIVHLDTDEYYWKPTGSPFKKKYLPYFISL